MAKDHLSYLKTLPESHLSNFPDHARLIGLILNEWNLVEHTLINLLAAVLHAERAPVQRMLKVMRTSRARLDAIEAANQGYLHFLFAPEELQDILDESRACLTRRNRYAHAHYYSRDGKRLLMVDVSEESDSDQRTNLNPSEHPKTRSKGLGFNLGSRIRLNFQGRLQYLIHIAGLQRPSYKRAVAIFIDNLNTRINQPAPKLARLLT